MQAWPLYIIDPCGTSAPIVFSRSASSSTIAADLPPSSSVTRFICSPQIDAMRRPTSVLPVKATLSTPGWRTRCSPTRAPPGITLKTPSGTPASSRTSARMNASSGVSGDGFRTNVQPASSAGASFMAVSPSGTFHGRIAPTTPTGSRRTTRRP